MKALKELMYEFPHEGRLAWLSRRPHRQSALEILDTLTLLPGEGITGDHYSGRSGKREVTLLQAEHLDVVAALCGLNTLAPERLRRNLLISGINLLACRQQHLSIGDDAVIEITGLCAPCSRMETELGPGGYNAMRGHGGMTARVIQGGLITLGDRVRVVACREASQHTLFPLS